MNKLDLFPCDLWSHDVSIYPEFKQKLIDEFYELKLSTQSVQISNVGGWQSPDLSVVNERSPTLKVILTKILIEVNAILGYEYKVRVQGMWYNINPSGASNNAHDHPGCDLAGVFYVKVPENSGDLILINPHNFVQANYINAISPLNPLEHHKVKPIEGRFVMFPAHMTHYVTKNNSKSDRMSIAMNLKITGGNI